MFDKFWTICKTGFLESLEKRDIYEPITGELYLTRYYLLFKDRPKWFPFNIFIHKFWRSDEPTLHDHPWSYITVLLRGGYWEHTGDGKRTWRKAGTIRCASSRSVHRIELDPGVDCWTLFIPGRRVKEWGFIEGGRWIDNIDYFRTRSKFGDM